MGFFTTSLYNIVRKKHATVAQTLNSRYPNLYNNVRKKYATVAEVLSTSPLSISFRRALVGNKLHELHNLVANTL
jgi:hypothetical protein